MAEARKNGGLGELIAASAYRLRTCSRKSSSLTIFTTSLVGTKSYSQLKRRLKGFKAWPYERVPDPVTPPVADDEAGIAERFR